jgi:hypothetical protein
MPVNWQARTPAEVWRKWGPRLTICLGAISHRDRSIVMVSDRMVTIGNKTADNSTIKWYAIHGDWCVEFAGDAGIGSLVLDRAIPLLAAHESHGPVEVAAAMERAVADERASLMCAQHGLTIDQINRLSPKEMRQLVRQTKFPCSFLIAGFDDNAIPHLLVVERDGKARICDSWGYWAVGSGQEIALASLARREQNIQRYDTLRSMYHLLEARFDAEVDPGVGKDETLAMVIQWRNYPTPILPHKGITQLRTICTAHNRDNYPSGAIELTRLMFQQGFTRVGKTVPPEWTLIPQSPTREPQPPPPSQE